VLDYEGDAETLGKNLGDDLREGKVTLPIIGALRVAAPHEQALIRDAIEAGNTTHLAEIQTIIQRSGALDQARQTAMSEAQRAIDAIARLPRNPYQEALIQLALGLQNRRV
jgi:octaprenyl-diphosphate synthase